MVDLHLHLQLDIIIVIAYKLICLSLFISLVVPELFSIILLNCKLMNTVSLIFEIQ